MHNDLQLTIDSLIARVLEMEGAVEEMEGRNSALGTSLDKIRAISSRHTSALLKAVGEIRSSNTELLGLASAQQTEHAAAHSLVKTLQGTVESKNKVIEKYIILNQKLSKIKDKLAKKP